MLGTNALLAVGLAALSVGPVAGDKIEYNRDIRPILAENCFSCHGPDSASRKAKLRLDQQAAAVKAGAIAPGKPAESELVRRIFAAEAKELMPPPASHKKLTKAQKEPAQTLDCRGGRVPDSLVLLAARACSVARGQEAGLGAPAA